jgi:hypothetical protein
MSDRREFLKMFGVGAAIVPIIGGLPQLAAEAKLIETPRVEIVESLSTLGTIRQNGFGMAGKYGITIIIDNIDGKRLVVMSADTYFTEVKIETMDIHSDRHTHYPQRVVTGRNTFEYEIKGRCTPDQAGNLMEVTGYEG